jgi:hypothetical protein
MREPIKMSKLVSRPIKRLSRPLRQFAFEAFAPLRMGRAPRRFHAYCVGAGKTGTHSIAGLFARHYRAAHEPEALWTIDTILSAAQGRLSSPRLEKHLGRRDRRLWLELESSTLCYNFIRTLVYLFPDAKFILTIRDCYSWLDSVTNEHFRVRSPDEWYRLRDLRFGAAGLEHPPEERTLADHHVYTLDGYLAYWLRHNRTVIETVPAARLLIVRTDRIRAELPRIAEFVEVPLDTLDQSQVHSYRAKQRFDLLAQIPPDYLEAKANAHCGELMQQYFPDRLRAPTRFITTVGIIAVPDADYNAMYWWFCEGVQAFINDSIGYLYALLSFQ